MIVPQPQQYPNWKSWAGALTRELLKPDINNTITLPQYTKATAPAPSTDGLIVFITDVTGGGQPVFSRGGNWYFFNNTILS